MSHNRSASPARKDAPRGVGHGPAGRERESRYRTVEDPTELQTLGFASLQCRVPALLPALMENKCPSHIILPAPKPDSYCCYISAHALPTTARWQPSAQYK